MEIYLIELNAVTAVNLLLALVVDPGDPELNRPVRLHHSLENFHISAKEFGGKHEFPICEIKSRLNRASSWI